MNKACADNQQVVVVVVVDQQVEMDDKHKMLIIQKFTPNLFSTVVNENRGAKVNGVDFDD